MRKLFAVLLLLALSFCLAGCSMDMSIDELLTAPSLTEQQAAVLSALQTSTEERIALSYPATGQNRAAIRETDLDGDGTSETVAFYTVPSISPYTHIAILEPTETGFRISATVEGLGSDIYSCSYIDASPAFRALLVEWSNPGKNSNNVTAYSYSGTELTLGFEENCTNLLVLDLDTDGQSDFCYITPPSMEEPFSLKYVKLQDNWLGIEGQRYLNDDVIAIRHVSSGVLADGTTAVFVDEQLQDGMQTEVFLLDEEGGLLPAVYSDGFDILSLSQRSDSELLFSRSIDGVACFPSTALPFDEVFSPESWQFWYSIAEGSITPQFYSFCNPNYDYFVFMPESWLASCLPLVTDHEPRVLRVYDTELGETVLTICALSVEENAAFYIEQGYSQLSTSGANRYYARFNCSEEDAAFIRDHFLAD